MLEPKVTLARLVQPNGLGLLITDPTVVLLTPLNRLCYRYESEWMRVNGRRFAKFANICPEFIPTLCATGIHYAVNKISRALGSRLVRGESRTHDFETVKRW